MRKALSARETWRGVRYNGTIVTEMHTFNIRACFLWHGYINLMLRHASNKQGGNKNIHTNTRAYL